MKFDLHTHHYRCGHADGEIRDYIEAAIQAGLQVIGISDHSPYFASEQDHLKPGIAMAKSEFPNYVAEVLKLKEEYRGKIEVLLGVESDFFPEHVELYRNVYAKYPFDYIIGSVHFTGDISIFNKKRFLNVSEENILKQKEQYFDLIRQSAECGMFQVLGHIDALKAYYPALSEVQTDKIDMALKSIAEHGVSIEVNTSGKNKTCGGWYPADDILERACHYGVEVTLGSDSHIPARVGDEWEEVSQFLKKVGFKHWVFYRQKQKQVVPL